MSGVSLLEFISPVRREKELTGTKAELSEQDDILLPWCLQNPQLGAWSDGDARWHPGCQEVPNLSSYSKSGAIRHLQRAVEYEGTIGERDLGESQRIQWPEKSAWGRLEDKLAPAVLCIHSAAVDQPFQLVHSFPFLATACSSRDNTWNSPTPLAVPTLVTPGTCLPGQNKDILKRHF